MAQPRTFQFYGLAYGNSPLTITASINSTQIFSGPVTTLDQPLPIACPDESIQTVLFTIDNSAALNTDFAGSLPMTLVVSGGSGVWVEQINCNYYAGNSTPAGTVDGYSQCYQGIPVNSDNSQDPRSSVVVNGVAMTPQRPPDGTWGWEIQAGQTMTHNFNIGVGSIANVVGNTYVVGNTSTYTGDYAAFLRS
jgi:hypothetical protein